jgi:hypothetical protein
MSTEKILTPSALNLSAVDLKAIASTRSRSFEIPPGSSQYMFVAEYVIAGTTPQAGVVDFALEMYLQPAAGGASNLIHTVTLADLIFGQAAGTYYGGTGWSNNEVVGANNTFGATEFTAGVTAASFVPFKAASTVVLKLLVDVTTAFDQAGAKTVSCWFMATQ